MAELIGFSELTKLSFYRALVAEFIATLLFLYITLLTVIGYLSQADMHQCSGVGVLGIAWSFGGMIFILVYCTVDISGGHINPAVTLGSLLAGKVKLVRAVMYMVVQCLGAICGAGLVKAYHKANYKKYGGGANVVAPGYSSGVGLAAEIIGTFILVNTVFSVPDREDCEWKKILGPLPVGFSVFMIHLATIPITGTGINPARSFGPAVMYNKEKAWDDQWIFWVGPFIGAAIAAIYHKFNLRTGDIADHKAPMSSGTRV